LKPRENNHDEKNNSYKAASVKDRITVLLADDHKILREGVKKLLELDPAFSVVGEADNGRLAVELSRELHPTIVLMDIAMPILNGIEAARQILRDRPSTRILILSAHWDDAYIERLITLGVAGYVLKHDSLSVLAQAIRQIVNGGTFFDPVIKDRLITQKDKTSVAHLSSREIEVLQLIAEGEPNKKIADDLHISIKTVEKHRQNLMNKLRIHDTAGLTRYAISAGIIENRVQHTTLSSSPQ
jgi:DNA-binding NarL/FixJ family response regulator